MRETVRGDSAQEIIARLIASDVCSDHDRSLVKKATGTWLMANCKKVSSIEFSFSLHFVTFFVYSKENYPSAQEFLKMAKSIVHYYPSTGNKASKSPWVCIVSQNPCIVSVHELFLYVLKD